MTGYGAGYIEVNRIRHTGSLLLTPETVQPWDADRLEQLLPRHFAQVLALEPELVLVGTGAGQRFAPAAILLPLVQAGIGFELMDTAAACRTFNILMAEGRRVVGAFLAISEIESGACP